ncbi:MAG: hypothetical protein HWQ38_15445, partial [Nostoc sp. NMS7]|nr:hypothetical protein [Nostoc sp. NMS7]
MPTVGRIREERLFKIWRSLNWGLRTGDWGRVFQCPMPNAQCPMPNAQCPM